MSKDPESHLITARRQQILAAAAQVFAEKGFHRATIKEIARVAGVADGTLYNYFQNKTDVLLAMFDLMQGTIQGDDALPALDTVNLREFIKAFVQHPLSAFKADQFELFRVVMSEIMIDAELRKRYYMQMLLPTLQIAEQQLTQWAEIHEQNLNVPLVVRTLSAVVMGLMMQYIMDDAPLQTQWETLPDFIADLVVKGIGNLSV